MGFLNKANFLLDITSTHDIVRRYFVVNGFDGALTMLGLIIGFLVSSPENLSVIINICLGAAIALGMSGLSSAYISEYAERRHALGKLEQAMVSDLQESAHGEASHWIPLLIAAVNGLAPLVISLIILMPLWLSTAGLTLPVPPLYAAIVIALLLIFLLGVFLGRIAGISWIVSGMQTMAVAMVTIILIYLFTGY